MGRYIIRRLIQAIPLLFLLSIFMFTLIHLLPGGPDQVLFNPHLSAAGRANLRAHFGLDDPVPIQYVKWLSRALTGDFGFSFATNLPVSFILSQRFPATLQLFGSAFALALVLAVVLGVVSAVRQGTVTDYSLTVVSYFGIAMPAFLVGLFLQYIFGVWLHVLPTSGTETLGYTLSPVDAFVDHLEHLILPMITLVALDFGAVAGGATITEGVFAWPGMGRLFFDSLQVRDYPVLLAILILGAFFVIVFNLIADILYAVMDPRIRYS